MISPVWLQLKPKDNKGGIMVEGLHDIDRNWLGSVKELNKKIKLGILKKNQFVNFRVLLYFI